MLPQTCLLVYFEATLNFRLANLLAHNDISQICYCIQISLQSVADNSNFSENLTPLGVTFILLALIHEYSVICNVFARNYFDHQIHEAYFQMNKVVITMSLQLIDRLFLKNIRTHLINNSLTQPSSYRKGL